MKYRTLGNTELEVSILSFGASSLGSVFGEIDESEGIRTVYEAIDLGINFIDVSPYYGLTKAETVLGKAIKNIPRDKFILSTKAGRYGENDFDFSSKRIIKSVDESLTRLQTDYIDILHLHDIEFVSLDQIIHESIPTLLELKKAGKIRFIGISGLPLKIFKVVSEQVPLDTILSYCHYTLNNTGLLTIEEEMRNKGIGIINASPLSMGLLTKKGPPDWHPASDEIKRVCRQAVQFCEEQGVAIEKLAVQFAVANDRIPTTLVGTANPKHIVRNVAWIEEPIDMELVNQVREILKPIDQKMWLSGRKENN